MTRTTILMLERNNHCKQRQLDYSIRISVERLRVVLVLNVAGICQKQTPNQAVMYHCVGDLFCT